MKTAISIDNKLFETAETTARKMGLTRSGLFTLALKEFLKHHSQKDIEHALNRYYEKNSNALDDTLAQAQTNSVDFGDW